jgi:hypothetical protein
VLLTCASPIFLMSSISHAYAPEASIILSIPNFATHQFITASSSLLLSATSSPPFPSFPLLSFKSLRPAQELLPFIQLPIPVPLTIHILRAYPFTTSPLPIYLRLLNITVPHPRIVIVAFDVVQNVVQEHPFICRCGLYVSD